MATLDYSDLRLGSNEIRLISLKSSTEGDTHAQWNVEVASLTDKSTNYCAVSYRWGAPLLEGRFKNMTDKPASLIQVNNHVVGVTKNLSDFLDQAKADEELKREKFWIDAICINQNDPAERSYQVSNMMAKIYQSAARVVAWLGDADLHTERAFDHLTKLAEPMTLPTFRAESGGNRSSWESTEKLFERTYWNRSWIIQELVLPEKVTVRCGKHSIDWSVLSEASHIISTGSARQFFNSATEPQPDAEMVRTSHRNYSIPTILKATKESMSTEHWTNVLLYTLIRSRNFEATNLEDKVYALFGLIQHSVDVGKMPLLRPEFGEDHSAARTYLKVAIQLLHECEELLLLSCVEGRSFQKVKMGDDNLPSWVPDWSEPLPLGLRVTGHKRYSADSCFTSPKNTNLSREEKFARWPAVVDGKELTVSIRGLKIDEIYRFGEPKHDIQKGKPFPGLLNILLSLPTQYQATKEDRLEALWRTLIANTAGKDRRAPRKSSSIGSDFGRWFRKRIDTVVTSQESDCQWAEMQQRFDEFCREDKGWKDLYAACDATSASDEPEFGTTFSHGQHLRPCVTKKGYLGLGSENLREGDTIWVVPRSRVPLIFRQVRYYGAGAGYHAELVGGIYLHGFMDGQALSAAAPSGVQLNDALETIVIH